MRNLQQGDVVVATGAAQLLLEGRYPANDGQMSVERVDGSDVMLAYFGEGDIFHRLTLPLDEVVLVRKGGEAAGWAHPTRWVGSTPPLDAVVPVGEEDEHSS